MKAGLFEVGDKVVMLAAHRYYNRGDRGIVVEHRWNDAESVAVRFATLDGKKVGEQLATFFVPHFRMRLDDPWSGTTGRRLLELE